VQLPQQLIHSLQSVEGFDECSFRAAHDEPAPVSIRFNGKKLDLANEGQMQGILSDGDLAPSHAVPWSSTGYYLQERPVFTLDPAIHGGGYYVQEASSMFLEYLLRQVLGDARGLKVVDLCAAPGGKTSLLASMEQFSLVLANEIIRTRVSILYENVVKWGDPKIFISNNDPSQFKNLPGYFDVMVVDAPCSGSGLFRKDKAALQEWSEANVLHCAERQKRILADALPALREGGILVYSTCSYSSREDEDVLDWLMGHPGLVALDMPVPESWGIVKTESKLGGKGFRFFPGKAEGEGFFIACFRMAEKVGGGLDASRKKPVIHTKASVPEVWLNQDHPVEIILAGEEVYCILTELFSDHHALREVLNIRKSGVKAGAMVRDEFLPDHELVLSNLASPLAPSLQLDKSAAIQYLRKQCFQLEAPEKGWYVVKYRQLGLGLVKHLGNRMNNYYPASWRILMS
jgi:16S rRNA C967 or C1407 C5-methylase (RsmB/RsmF family)/NOL1/NOP2/fmu family ribosome biogenesis protein